MERDYRHKRPHEDDFLVDETCEEFTVDLCIVMDATSSMNSYMEKIVLPLSEVIKELQSQVSINRKSCSLRTAVTLYRDFSSSSIAEDRTEGRDFSTQHSKVLHMLKKIKTEGGGDIPENVLGGLNTALNYSWKGQRRFLVLIGDAPCHGKQYHNFDDHYSDGDPTGLTPEGVLNRMREKDIRFIFMKLTSETNKMMEAFRSIYDNPRSKNCLQGLKMQTLDVRGSDTNVGKMLYDTISAKIQHPPSLMFFAAKLIKGICGGKHRVRLDGIVPQEMIEFVDSVHEGRFEETDKEDEPQDKANAPTRAEARVPTAVAISATVVI